MDHTGQRLVHLLQFAAALCAGRPQGVRAGALSSSSWLSQCVRTRATTRGWAHAAAVWHRLGLVVKPYIKSSSQGKGEASPHFRYVGGSPRMLDVCVSS